MNHPILSSKLRIPPQPSNLVPRPRLTKRLTAGLERRLTLISAPAGFGKTTLLTTWVEMLKQDTLPIQIAWLSLDARDNDLVRFLTYLLAGLRSIFPDLDTGVLHAFQTPEPPSLAAGLTPLVNELAVELEDHAQITTSILILDDYHVINNRKIHQALDFLLTHAPPQLHLILATRSDPALKLAHLRGRGQLTEIRQPDLRFTSQEIKDFLSTELASKFNEDVCDVLASRTEGWIAGLRIATTLLQKQTEVHTFVRTFSGSNRYIMDYLVEEVLNQQPADVRVFLLQTSILDSLTGSLCDAVTGQTGGQQTLEQFERENLFVTALDDQQRWYRYHGLFADLLYRRLQQEQPAQILKLHRRASSWYERRELWRPAVDHALRGEDFEHAADLIESLAEQLWGQGEHTTLLQWLQALPDTLVESQPRLSIFYALVAFTNGDRRTAEARLQTAETKLQATADVSTVEDQGIVAAVRAYVSFAQGDLPLIIDRARQALQDLPDTSLTWQSMAYYALGLAQRLRGELETANQTLTQAAEVSLAAKMIYISLVTRLNLAIVRLQQGQLRRGAEGLRQALALAESYGIRQTPIAGLLSAYLGNIMIEWHHLEEAVTLIGRGVGLCKQGGDMTALGLCYTFLVRAHHARGAIDQAQTVLQQLKQLTLTADVPPLLEHWATALEAQLFLDQGKISLAAQCLEEVQGLSLDTDLSYLHEPEHLTWARLLLAQQRITEATKLLVSLREIAQARGQKGRLISILILTARAHQASGEIERATEVLGQAVSLAADEEYRWSFIAEGPALVPLLKGVLLRGERVAYVRELLQKLESTAGKARAPINLATDRPVAQLPIGTSVDALLTPREHDVLRLLATELSMREIAEELYIAKSTVRSHVKHIYSKLNVHSRIEALVRAQELKLL